MEEFVVELSPEEEMIRQAIEPLLDSEGYELVRIRLKKAQAKSLLALFVDTAGKKNGIVMENLTDISRLLSDVLDASFDEHSILRGRYDLEVSSPGLNRPLTKRTHFKDSIGEKIKIRLRSAEEGAPKGLVGVLLETADDEFVIEPEAMRGEKVSIRFADVFEAHCIFDFSSLEKHAKKSKK